MKFLSSGTIRRQRRALGACLVALAISISTALGCAIQESNTYPIEIFSEMHYSQASRSQEPPRLAPQADAVPFVQIGTDMVLDVPAILERPYDPSVAKDLFRVNCSVCHGDEGAGDGPASLHIISGNSYYASVNGEPYASPANLKDKREEYEIEAMINIISNGIVVMPGFGNLLSPEEIRDIATYVYDKSTGIGP